MIETEWRSGHILRAQHIEEPKRMVRVKWFQPEKRVPVKDSRIRFAAGMRWAKVLCATDAGADAIVKYHNPGAKNIEIISMTRAEVARILQGALADGTLAADQLIARQMAVLHEQLTPDGRGTLAGVELDLAIELEMKASEKKGK
jgi:hypothetical protein